MKHLQPGKQVHSCVNSSIKIYFDEPKMIEFITIDESVNNTSSNVKEIQIGSIFELTGDDSFSEWFDLLEKSRVFRIYYFKLIRKSSNFNRLWYRENHILR